MATNPTCLSTSKATCKSKLSYVEHSFRQHEVVPTCLIERIAGLKAGLARRCIKDLARNRVNLPHVATSHKYSQNNHSYPLAP